MVVPKILASHFFRAGRFRLLSGPGALRDRSDSENEAERWGLALWAWFFTMLQFIRYVGSRGTGSDESVRYD
eukprot:2548064-Pyramimonas_sp.AAC.1